MLQNVRALPQHATVQRFDFADDEVVGELKRPDSVLDSVALPARHKSLVEVPRDFIAATAKMLEDL